MGERAPSAETLTALFDVDALRMRDAGREEMSEADMQRYEKYLASDLDLASLAKVTKRQMDRIKVGWSNPPCLFEIVMLSWI